MPQSFEVNIVIMTILWMINALCFSIKKSIGFSMDSQFVSQRIKIQAQAVYVLCMQKKIKKNESKIAKQQKAHNTPNTKTKSCILFSRPCQYVHYQLL